MIQSLRTVRHLTGYYLRVLKLTWEANPKYALISLLLNLGTAAVAPMQLWLSKTIIDRVVATVQASGESAPADWRGALAPVLLLLAAWAAAAMLSTIESSYTVVPLMPISVVNHARYVLHRKASSLDLAFYENAHYYDRLDFAMEEIWRAYELAWTPLYAIRSLVALLAMLGMLSRLHLGAIPLLVVMSLPRLIAHAHFVNVEVSVDLYQSRGQRMFRYLMGLLRDRQGAKEIRLFGLSDLVLTRTRAQIREFFAQHEKVALSRIRGEGLLGVLPVLGTAGIWAWAGVLALQGLLALGDLVLVLQAAHGASDQLTGLFHWMGQLYGHSAYVANFFEFLDLDPHSVEGTLVQIEPTDGPVPSVPVPIRQNIEFRDVSFRYPGSDCLALKGLSFSLQPGHTVALVGANGAGKTTVAKLLARLYDPTEGSILIGGRDLREYDPEDYWGHVGVIFQDFVKYDLSVRDNIGFGQIDYLDDRERLATAAAKAGALDMIEDLPEGFDTMLGKAFEGTDLSLGQWQKIALARAFMRDAQILILDEPTASLDAMAEYEVYKRFAELSEGKTTILISHRFSTVRMADHILVLEESRLIEEGTHEELRALGGHYVTMFNMQAEGYR